MMNRDERIKLFDEIMKGICSQCFIDNLVDAGYFDAPAGMKHHGVYEGALFDHSLQVTYELNDLSQKLNLHWERPGSEKIIGFLHDLCKIKQYNKIQTATEAVEYEWNKRNNLSGHGEASLIRIMELEGPQLTREEIYCIRYHMGAYEGQQAWEPLDKAIKEYPNILYTHMADMIASKLKEV